MRFPSLLLTLLLAASAHAEIFQCDVDGHKVFSQQPCGKDATSVTLENRPRQITIPDEPDEAYARDFCGLAVSAFDMVVSRQHDLGKRRNYSAIAISQEQIARYLRERISNYQEKSREGPQVEYMISEVSSLLYRLAASTNQQTSPDINMLRTSCNDAAKRLLNARAPSSESRTPAGRPRSAAGRVTPSSGPTY